MSDITFLENPITLSCSCKLKGRVFSPPTYLHLRRLIAHIDKLVVTQLCSPATHTNTEFVCLFFYTLVVSCMTSSANLYLASSELLSARANCASYAKCVAPVPQRLHIKHQEKHTPSGFLNPLRTLSHTQPGAVVISYLFYIGLTH